MMIKEYNRSIQWRHIHIEHIDLINEKEKSQI